MDTSDVFDRITRMHKSNAWEGICAVCDSNPWVIRAAMDQARHDGSVVLIESTVTQVNQDGGYTGMTPATFRTLLDELADEAGLPRDRVLLGGDHIGPSPWKDLPAHVAMEKACALAAELVAADYVKIHLDATVPLPGDKVDPERGLDPRLVAEREASMAAAAEDALRQAARAARGRRCT